MRAQEVLSVKNIIVSVLVALSGTVGGFVGSGYTEKRIADLELKVAQGILPIAEERFTTITKNHDLLSNYIKDYIKTHNDEFPPKTLVDRSKANRDRSLDNRERIIKLEHTCIETDKEK